MHRREFLAAGATLSIAATGGCTGCVPAPRASLRMDETDDLGIAREVTYQIEDDPARRDFWNETIEGGSSLVNDTRQPYPVDRPAVHDGAIYELHANVTDTRPARVFHFTLERAEGEVTPSAIVRFEDLPAVDREKLAGRGLDEDPFLGIGSSLRYFEPEIPESMLVPEPAYPVIEWDAETRGHFSVDGARETAVKTYRYTVEQVHTSAAAFGRSIREAHAFTLSGLTDGERAIVTEAIENDGGWNLEREESPPDALFRLIERFGRHEEVLRVWEADRDDGPAGDYVHWYDGTLYWTHLGVNPDELTRADR